MRDMADGQRQQTISISSHTTTQTSTTETRTETPRILRLRGGEHVTKRLVQWAESVVDNEGLGRKSSKVCCIYHKPKAVDESSDESSSDSSSDSSDSAADNSRGERNIEKTTACGHSRHNRGHVRRTTRQGKQKRPPSPNAYEKIPKSKINSDRGRSPSQEKENSG